MQWREWLDNWHISTAIGVLEDNGMDESADAIEGLIEGLKLCAEVVEAEGALMALEPQKFTFAEFIRRSEEAQARREAALEWLRGVGK